MGSHWTLKRSFQGTFFWDYSVDSYSGIRITEHTDYQFPKEQTLCYSENRIADVTKNEGDETEEVWVHHFPAKRRAKIAKRTQLPAILSILNKPVFHLLCLFCNTILYILEYYSIHSRIRIGPKRTQLPPIPCILIPE